MQTIRIGIHIISFEVESKTRKDRITAVLLELEDCTLYPSYLTYLFMYICVSVCIHSDCLFEAMLEEKGKYYATHFEEINLLIFILY